MCRRSPPCPSPIDLAVVGAPSLRRNNWQRAQCCCCRPMRTRAKKSKMMIICVSREARPASQPAAPRVSHSNGIASAIGCCCRLTGSLWPRRRLILLLDRPKLKRPIISLLHWLLKQAESARARGRARAVQEPRLKRATAQLGGGGSSASIVQLAGLQQTTFDVTRRDRTRQAETGRRHGALGLLASF